jgi:hypothetical protein
MDVRVSEPEDTNQPKEQKEKSRTEGWWRGSSGKNACLASSSNSSTGVKKKTAKKPKTKQPQEPV